MPGLHALAYADLTDATADDLVELEAAAERDLEDLTVQVQLNCQGPWHRKAVGGLFTACGKPIAFAYALGRHERYEDQLCPEGCFTPFELAIAEQANAKRDKDDR